MYPHQAALIKHKSFYFRNLQSTHRLPLTVRYFHATPFQAVFDCLMGKKGTVYGKPSSHPALGPAGGSRGHR
jgi:hypothetical protein